MNTNSNEDREKENNLNIFSKKSLNKKGFSFTKIKGSTSFVERLKNVSKRDIAYFIVGVSILILAPVAEYFLSKPNANTALTPGFGERRSSESAGIYEPGVNALSAGSPDGMEEVVAPLTARDPSSLILGAQEEPSPQIPTPPPTETKRDSIADIAKKSFSEATKSSPAPFIPPKMNASLRGASSFFGGDEGTKTSGVLSSGNILANAKNAPSQAQKKSMLGPQAIPGYKGVASQSDSVNKGAFEKLRNQADKAAGYFSGANASESLEKAGAASINPASDGGFGALQDGGRNTNPSGSSTRGSFSFSPGDPCRGSIERELACENARKANDFKNFLKYDLKKKIIESAVDNIINKGLLAPIGEKVANATKRLLNQSGPSPAPKYCWVTKDKKISVMVHQDNNGVIQLVPPVGLSDCPCGFLTTDPDPSCTGGSQTGGGQQPSQPGNSGVPTSTSTHAGPATSSDIPSDIRSDLENYDSLLVKAIESANKGREATKIDELKQNSSVVAENLEQAVSLAQKISNSNITVIDKTNFKKIGEYKTSITETESKLKTLKDDYSKFTQEITSFKSTLEKAIADYRSGKIKPKLSEGVTAETLGGSEVLAKLEEAKQKVDKIKQDSESVRDEYLVKFENRLKSHNAAYSWYVNQVKLCKDSNAKVYSQSGPQSQEIRGYKTQIASVPDGAADEGSLNTLKTTFMALTGQNPQNISIQPKNIDASGGPLAKADYGLYRMSPASDNKIDIMISWRSADKEQAWAGKINDQTAVDQDNRTFESVKPSTKLSKGEFSSSFENLPVETSFVLSLVRAMNVDKDVEESKKFVASVLDGIDGFNVLMGANKTDLENIKTELKPLLDQLNPVQPQPSQPSHSTPSHDNPPITIVNNVIVGASANSNSNSSASANSISNTVKPTQQPPAPQPSHPASPQPNSQEVMKYQSLLNVHIDNIKELKSKKSSLKSENDIAYESLLKCLNSVAIYLPGGCGKKEKAFNDANSRYLNAIGEVRQAKEDCRKYYNSIPDKIRKLIVGECN